MISSLFRSGENTIPDLAAAGSIDIYPDCAYYSLSFFYIYQIIN